MIITSGGIGQYVTIRAWSADGRLQADHPVGRLGEPPHRVPAAQYPAAADRQLQHGCWLCGLCPSQSTHRCLGEVYLHAVTCGTSTPSTTACPLLTRQASS